MVAVPEETGAEAAGRRSGGADRPRCPCDAEDTDDAPMLGADTSGFTLVMDTLAGDGGRHGAGDGLRLFGRRRIRHLPARGGGRIPLRFRGASARSLRRGGRGAAGGRGNFRPQRRALALCPDLGGRKRMPRRGGAAAGRGLGLRRRHRPHRRSDGGKRSGGRAPARFDWRFPERRRTHEDKQRERVGRFHRQVRRL